MTGFLGVSFQSELCNRGRKAAGEDAQARARKAAGEDTHARAGQWLSVSPTQLPQEVGGDSAFPSAQQIPRDEQQRKKGDMTHALEISAHGFGRCFLGLTDRVHHDGSVWCGGANCSPQDWGITKERLESHKPA